jgi:hypothetical protein
MMDRISWAISISVLLGILLIDGIPPGVGLILVLMMGISFQISKQQSDVRKLAEAVTFIALVLKAGMSPEEPGE